MRNEHEEVDRPDRRSGRRARPDRVCRRPGGSGGLADCHWHADTDGYRCTYPDHGRGGSGGRRYADHHHRGRHGHHRDPQRQPGVAGLRRDAPGGPALVPQPRIEYITELPNPLTENGPFYTDVQPGDLVYYNPMDSITIIYEETSSVPTLTYMGEITSELSVFRNLPDDVDLQIALAE